MTETIPVRLDRETLETLDLFVKTGLYKNRSEAIRQLMKRGLDAQAQLATIGRLVRRLEELDSAGELDFSGMRLERDAR